MPRSHNLVLHRSRKPDPQGYRGSNPRRGASLIFIYLEEMWIDMRRKLIYKPKDKNKENNFVSFMLSSYQNPFFIGIIAGITASVINDISTLWSRDTLKKLIIILLIYFISGAILYYVTLFQNKN